LAKSNSLDSTHWEDEAKVGLRKMLKKFSDYQEEKDNKENFKYFDFDVLMSNPPFAGNVEETHILKNYDLAKKKGKTASKMERHILFIERNLNFLKDGGRMAVVLPQGVFNNTTTKNIREYLSGKARILGVVSLHENTFKPHTGTKTSVLFLQKWDSKKCPKKEDYPIFFGISTESGKDNSGSYIFKRDSKNQYIIDDFGHPIIKHDLDVIVKEFKKFVANNNLSFH
jgi:type I restriction enzyme M protein